MDISKIKIRLLNRENMIIFYFYSLFIRWFAFGLIFPIAIKWNIVHFLWIINAVWAFIIICDDIKKEYYKSYKIFDWIQVIYIIYIFLTWFFLAKNHSFFYLHEIVTYIQMGYIVYSYPKKIKKEKIECFFAKISQHYVCIVFMLTLVSVILYVFGISEIKAIDGNNIMLYEGSYGLGHTAVLSRYFGLFSVSTLAGFFCYLAVILHFYFIEKKSHIFFQYFGILLNSYMIFLTDSRCAKFILFLSFLFFIIKKFKINIYTKKFYKIILLFLLGSIGIILMFKFDLLKEIISNPYQILNNLSSNRLGIAKLIFESLNTVEKILFGLGWCNNIVLQQINEIHPHNLFLSIYLYTGIIGVIIFFIFLITNIRQIIKNNKIIKDMRCEWLVVIIIAVFVESCLDICIIGDAHVETIFFWLSLGILVNLNYIC